MVESVISNNSEDTLDPETLKQLFHVKALAICTFIVYTKKSPNLCLGAAKIYVDPLKIHTLNTNAKVLIGRVYEELSLEDSSPANGVIAFIRKRTEGRWVPSLASHLQQSGRPSEVESSSSPD